MWLCLTSLSQLLLLVEGKKRLEERSSLLITNKDPFLERGLSHQPGQYEGWANLERY